MNLSSAFQKLKTKQYQLTATQRLMVVVAIGLIAIIIAIYTTTSEVTVQSIPPDNSFQQQATPLSKPVMPIGNQMFSINQVEQTIRDPFAKPPEAKEQRNDTDRGLPFIQNNIVKNIPSNVPTTVPKTIVPSIPSDNFKLTGIVGNAERRLAVIMSANKSQSYSLNDVIGTYKIVAINDDSVILKNTTGKLVLRLE